MKIQYFVTKKKINIFLLTVFCILSIVNLYIQISKYYFHHREEWMVMFNLDREMNFPTLYATILLIICASILKQIYLEQKKNQNILRKRWKHLSSIFYFLAFDEFFQIHEVLIIPDLGKGLWGIFHQVWVIPYLVFVMICIVYFWKLILLLPRNIMILFFLSGFLYVGGALGLEMIGGIWIRYAQGMQNLTYSLMASTEEMMEMLGIIVFINALLIYMTKYQEESLKIQIKID